MECIRNVTVARVFQLCLESLRRFPKPASETSPGGYHTVEEINEAVPMDKITSISPLSPGTVHDLDSLPDGV